MKVSILKFQDVKTIHKLFNGIGLHSCGPDASFDTHIAISIYDIGQMACIKYGIFGIFDINDAFGIGHFSILEMPIWVSKEA